MRRTLSVMVVLFMAIGAAPVVSGGSVALAAAGPQPWTVQPGLMTTVTGPPDAEFPVTIDYDLYVPANATALTPQPAVVLAHGFGNAKDAAELRTLGAFFASHGYVTLASSHMGFGKSTGCISLDLASYDGRNVVGLIDVLAARPDVLKEGGDPVVGMVGGSYGGGHQGGVAAQDDRLDAFAPGRTWNSLQYSLVPNNLVTTGMWNLDDYAQGVFKQGWTSLFYALGSTQPLMGNGGCDPINQQLQYPGQPYCPGFDPRVCPIFSSLASTGDVSEEQRQFIGGGAIANQVPDIDVPVLLMQGESDTLFNLTEAIATYEALDARGVDVNLVFNWGGHGYQPRPGEGDPFSGAFDETAARQDVFGATYLAGRMLAFFDEHLRGAPDQNPRVAWFADWIDYDIATSGGTAAPAYRTAADYPVGGVTAFRLDLAGQALVPAEASVPVASTASIVNPADGSPSAHSETPNFTGEGQPGAGIPPQEVPGQHVALDSPALIEPLEVVGTGTVLLPLSNANSQDAVVFVKLYDVAPDGTATLIRRLVTASRVPAEELPGSSFLRVPGIVHRFDVDHRIRLVIATTDDSYRNPTVPDQVTLSSGGDSGAVLSLPTTTGPLLERIAGPDRIQTAVQLSRTTFDAASTAVLAAAGDFPDALASGGLAAAAGGPLLLTGTDGVRDDVLDEIRRLGVDRVYVAGGTASLSSAVEADLAGFDVRRLAGPDRFSTAAAVAAETARILGGVQTIALARGDDFADALAAGSLAAQGVPVLLTAPGSLPGATQDALDGLDPERVLILGGTAAVSDAVAGQLGRPSQRLAGATRYETAQAILVEAQRLRGSAVDTIFLASGISFADALAAGPAAHAAGGVLMLTAPSGLDASPPTADVLSQGWERAYLVGGYAALSPVLDGQVAAVLGAAG